VYAASAHRLGALSRRAEPVPGVVGNKLGRHRHEMPARCRANNGPHHSGSGSELVHLISSRQTLERTPLTPGSRISSDFKSCAITLIT
jgi:hypothetical protein